jgi:hypothetical protein
MFSDKGSQGPAVAPKTFESEGSLSRFRALHDSSTAALPFPDPTDPLNCPRDPAAVVAAWPTLPEPVRAGILAMVRASKIDPSGA